MSFFNKLNQSCPNCNNNLNLFLRITTSNLWTFDKNTNYFNKLRIFDDFTQSQSFLHLEDDKSFCLFNNKLLLLNKSMPQDFNFYLFYLCNPNAILPKYNDFEIDVKKSCFYNSTKLLTYNNSCSPDQNTCKYEVYSFSQIKSNIEVNYIISFNLEENKTDFWSYQVPLEELNNNFFEPEIFEKSFSTIVKLDFSNKEKLFNKFETWLVIS